MYYISCRIFSERKFVEFQASNVTTGYSDRNDKKKKPAPMVCPFVEEKQKNLDY